MSLDPAILDALEEVLNDQPQRPELKVQLKQLLVNWFDSNASDEDVVRIVRMVHVNAEGED